MQLERIALLAGLAALVPYRAAQADRPPPAPLEAHGDATDPDGRRSIRGGPVDPQPNESPELAEMRRFEERAFGGREPPAAPTATGDEEGAPALDPAFLKSLKLPDLPVRWDARVLRYLQFYKSDPKGRAIMTSWLRKQGRWRALMSDALQRHSLPLDLVYVSMIESGYEPLDLSRVGASGLWQFMEAGGKIYGLERGYWVDDRRNPERATEAAMIYLGDLRVRFANWHLALAAFNAGYGAVLKSMQRYNTNDYWELCRHESGLPWETCLYVSKVIATAIVGNNRAAFGYSDLEDEPAWSYDRVKVPGGTPLAVAGRACASTEAQLGYLNPELRRNRVPPGREWELRIPHGTADKFAETFPPLRRDLDRYEVHVMRFGERLEDVARARRVSVRELKRINGITDSTEVRGGTEILVPRERGKVSDADLPPADSEETLLVPVPDRNFEHPDRKRVFYRTRDGDTPAAIAETFGVKTSELATWNNLDLEANLTSRMVLQILVPEGTDLTNVLLVPDERVKVVPVGSDEFLTAYAAQKGRKRTSYTCRDGDTMQKVGRRFGLTAGDLARINQISFSSELKAGQKLVVYVPVTAQARKDGQQRLRQAARVAAKYASARKRAQASAANAKPGSHAQPAGRNDRPKPR
jgi:membrane-bound lytic murein transglycosylase D